MSRREIVRVIKEVKTGNITLLRHYDDEAYINMGGSEGQYIGIELVDGLELVLQQNKELKKDNQRLQRKVKEPISVDRIAGLTADKVEGLELPKITFDGRYLTVVDNGTTMEVPILPANELTSIEDHEKVVSQLEALKKKVKELDLKSYGIAGHTVGIEKLEEKVAELEKRPVLHLDEEGNLTVEAKGIKRYVATSRT